MTLHEKITSSATYGGGVTAFIGGLSANEIAAYGGLLIGAVGLLSNTVITWHFKSQHLKLAREVAKEKPDCATCPERDE